MVLGHVTAGVIVLMGQTKLHVLNFLVKTKVYGIVAMANVFLQAGYVMDLLIPVMQVGVQIVLMAQTKV